MSKNPNGPQNGGQNDVAQLAALALTPSGLAPSSMTWELTEDQICQNVKTVLTDLVGDIREVSLEVDRHGNPPVCFAWLPNNSDHIIDSSTKNSSLTKAIHSYSKEMKELIDKYCPKDCKRLIADANPGSHLVGIPIDLQKIFRVILDVDGVYAKNTYGTNQVKSRLTLTAIYRSGEGNEKYGKLLYIEMTKSTSIRTRRKPKPTKNFNY